MSAGNWNGRQVTMAAVGMAIVMALADYFNLDLFNVTRAEQAVYVVEGDGWLVIWREGDGAPRVAAIPVGAKWAGGWNADGIAPTHVAVIEALPNGDHLIVVPVP